MVVTVIILPAFSAILGGSIKLLAKTMEVQSSAIEVASKLR